MNILQWNCEGEKAKYTVGDIPFLIKQTGANCIVLQETKQSPNASFQIKGFKAYRKNLNIQDGQLPHGGVAIHVKNYVSSYRVELQTTLQAVAVSIKIRKRITVCSLYLPPGEDIRREQLQELVDQLPKPFLILGDMNAHHPMWYDPRNIDRRGETIVDLIADNDLALLDQNKMTSIWKVDKSFSHIDLSICSAELLTWFQWDVYDEPLSSDHFPILLKAEIQRNSGGTEKWIMKKADWELYTQSSVSDQNIAEFNSVQEAAEFFENHVKEAATKAIPKTKGTGKRKSPPWWNGKCRAAIWKRKAALRRYRRTASAANFNKYSKTRAEAKRVIKQSKKLSWAEFINSINSQNTTKEVWKKINMLSNRFKSTSVSTIILNKEVKISNIPTSYKNQLIKQLCDMGCVQTLKAIDEEIGVSSILVRFESDTVTDRALQLNGSIVQGHTVQAGLTINPQDQSALPDVLDESKDIADCLGRRFSYISSERSADPRFKEQKDRAESEDLNFGTDEHIDYNSDITSQEMEHALKIAKDSSPGPDEICYSMLQNLAPSGKKLLLELLNRIFTEGTFPVRWKEAYIIPILKDGKQDTSSSSYRPIALTSCICKLFERILNRRLVRFLESKGLTDIYQSGFRKGRSTLDCLAKLVTEAHNAYRRKQYFMCIFFDLEKAYDTCWKHLIMKQLHKFGLRGKLPLIIQDFLTNRKFRVKVADQMSEVYEQEMGVPQGGVLSCSLFSIAINTVVEVIKGLTSYSIYVDDKQIGYAHSDPNTCRRRLQQSLDALNQWSIKTGFRFSVDKTEWMVFHRNKKELIPGQIKLTLDGKNLKEVKIKKFLGLILDRTLAFKEHVAYLRGKCLRDLNIIKVISRGNREIDSKVLLRIYRALIRPKLDYACQIYGTAPSSSLDSLDPVHHKGIRICLGAYRTSPAESLYVEANEPSLKDRRQMLQLQYYVRMKQFLPGKVPVRLDDTSLDGEYARKSNKPIALGYTVRQSITNLNISLPNIAVLAESPLGPWEVPQPEICMALAVLPKRITSVEKYEQYFLQHKHNTDIDLYTDGSKSKEGVGSGVAMTQARGRYTGIKRRLHETASIFTAELYAIKLALLSIRASIGISCAVYSDSRSALQAIKGQSSCKIVQEILGLVVILKRREIKVVFCWIPGHCNITGNENADKEAKSAVDLTVISSQEIPVSDVKMYVKQKMREKVKKDWTNFVNERGEQPKLKEICPDVRGTPISIGLSRIDTMKLVRLRIGHTRVTHSFRVTGEDMPWCIECETPMTVKHILLECGNCARERYAYYDPREVTLKMLLTTREYVVKVLQFLKEITWYREL